MEDEAGKLVRSWLQITKTVKNSVHWRAIVDGLGSSLSDGHKVSVSEEYHGNIYYENLVHVAF